MNNSTLSLSCFLKEIKLYFFGFLFSIFLTTIPFFIVFSHIFKVYVALMIIIFCAVIQCVVHLKIFLHLSYSSKNYWNFIFLLFTFLIILIIISGSIWIMCNLNHHFYYHSHHIT
ncbi:cytochrome o ubiquinol oxidase subunit IV [Buchnera aphidicola]|uniref:Cytochrome bo(3) ubiquinol oxidase subunit 4 n=1 Tax=Buchnera aphidicola (Sarucallis kahawaluokalani) TaxID=1241878 RepID=A0A4D6YK74_9GAMM|nr:cytochrome o ubiquinol oxidase subunit IV [Buchnera aphidicola]QCI26088.1 cytochrome o ubiquinol oxidase subunit IV [Buchnera aphidicola (Sarucallis kahawaluokalani)]